MQSYRNDNEPIGLGSAEKNTTGRQEKKSSPTTTPPPPIGGLRFANEWDQVRPDQIPGF